MFMVINQPFMVIENFQNKLSRNRILFFRETH